MKSIYVITWWGAVILTTLRCCTDKDNPLQSAAAYRTDRAVPFGSYTGSLSLCRWKNDKQAAYSIAFDDATRSSHYLVSAPELEEHGLRGTFNLNTKNLPDWKAWQKLFDKGHEIASHGWSHQRMGELDETTLHVEFSRAKADLLDHIKGLKGVPSFTFPMGSSSALARAIALQYHRSARAGSGVNDAVLTQEELSRVKGIGVYPPYDMNRFNAYAHEAIARGGWVLFYFHTVSAVEESGDTTIPLSLFRAHLDFITARSDSFWFATQGEAATYIYVRSAVTPEVSVKDERVLQVTLKVPAFQEETSLSVRVTKPEEWLHHRIVIEEDGAILQEYDSSDSAVLVCDLPINRTVWIWARK